MLSIVENYDQLKKFVVQFNNACNQWKNLNQGTQTYSDLVQAKAGSDLLQTLINYCYDLCISQNAHKLNHYAAFSPETYGETNFKVNFT